MREATHAAMISADHLHFLAAYTAGPCVSVYLPTHRAGKEIRQDPIRLKNLLSDAAERLLATGMRSPEARDLLAPARELLVDSAFWRHQADGLALFLALHSFRSYRLPHSFQELVVVTNRFHLKPLLPLLSGDQRFCLLAVSAREVRFYQCTRYSLVELSVEHIRRSLDEVLQYDDRKRQLQFHTRTPSTGGQRAAVYHGHGVGSDDVKTQLLRYFQHVDRGLHEQLRTEHAPLVLAAVEHYHAIYRQANSYQHLVEEGIKENPQGVPAEELRDKAWSVVRPIFQRSRREHRESYQQLAGSKRASDDVREVVPAAYHGRVAALFVAVGRQRWGTFDPNSNQVFLHPAPAPTSEDLLDFAAIHTVLQGGTVYAVAPKAVPGPSELAAVFRY